MIPKEIKEHSANNFLLVVELFRKVNETSMRIPQELSGLILELKNKTDDTIYYRDTIQSYESLANDVKECLEMCMHLFDEMKRLEETINPDNFS